MAVSAMLIAIAGTAWIEHYRVDAVDREYAARLTLLKREQAAHPNRPLFLVVGSSRMVMGFGPEEMPPVTTADGDRVTVFNASHLGAGPVMNHTTLTRLQREGIVADWVVLEVMAGFLPKENAALVTSASTARDVWDSHGYYRPGELWWEYLKHRTAGLPSLARRATVEDDPTIEYGHLGSAGFVREAVDPAFKARLIAAQKSNFGFRLADLKASDGSDRALRDSVRMLQAQGTRVRLLMSPEQAEFTRMYQPGGREWFANYVQELGDELGVPVTDARDWLDPDDFEDGHHALRRGRTKFTERLGREVIGPMVEGEKR